MGAGGGGGPEPGSPPTCFWRKQTRATSCSPRSVLQHVCLRHCYTPQPHRDSVSPPQGRSLSDVGQTPQSLKDLRRVPSMSLSPQALSLPPPVVAHPSQEQHSPGGAFHVAAVASQTSGPSARPLKASRGAGCGCQLRPGPCCKSPESMGCSEAGETSPPAPCPCPAAQRPHLLLPGHVGPTRRAGRWAGWALRCRLWKLGSKI